MGVVCIGVGMAIAAGVAYGYNYSMAEFLTFTRSDVTVYLHRGHGMYDFPDIEPISSSDDRSGDYATTTEDALNLELTSDYQDLKPEELPPATQGADTRKYAERLTKYSAPKADDNAMQTNPPMRMSAVEASRPITSDPSIRTQVPQSMTSQIILRELLPLDAINDEDTIRETVNDESFSYQGVEDVRANSSIMMDYAEEKRKTELSDVGIRLQDSLRPVHEYNVPLGLRDWKTTDKILQDYSEIDEDNVVYKPV